jgi:uncharacterized UBP type Zn finger protein
MEKQDPKEPASNVQEDKKTEVKVEEVKKEEAKKEEAKKQEEGKPISDMVNQAFAAELMAMGFSKAVSEKALFLTGNTATDKAIEWIEGHQQDPDFEEELRIVGWAI